MVDIVVVVVLVLTIIVIVLQVVVLRRGVAVDLSPLERTLDSVQTSYVRAETTVRDEIAKNRQELVSAERASRGELNGVLKNFGDSVSQGVRGLSDAMGKSQERIRQSVETRLQSIQDATATKLEHVRQDSLNGAKLLRDEVANALRGFNESIRGCMATAGETQKNQLELFSSRLGKLIDTNQQNFDALKTAVQDKLKNIQEDNAKQLEQMRQTVDEKLQGTLERRLGDSFKLVSERLEQVHKGLGEMQTLATGVGDLKKVLTNVRARGTWGEVQLGMLLEQVLAPDQYSANLATKAGGERVEFAIKLPGRADDCDEVVWLPIDAKFPIEDYQRLLEAYENADAEAAELAGRQLENRIKLCAADICSKYLNPPRTTDFAIMFLPIEGLFAEVARRTGLPEYVQRECRVVITGPTTLWSLLNSLQVGFRTLAIQKRSSEVWNLLSAVKTEWAKYGAVLEKVQKKLQEASNTVDEASRRTRVIGRKLKGVEELPTGEAQAVLLIGDGQPGVEPYET